MLALQVRWWFTSSYFFQLHFCEICLEALILAPGFIGLQHYLTDKLGTKDFFTGAFLNIPSSNDKFQIFAAVAYDLWFYRNKSHQEGINVNIHHISKHINLIAMEHYNTWHPSLLTVIEIEKWIPPKLPWVTINFDTAIKDSFSIQAAVYRNSQGRILCMTSQLSPPCHPNYGEALAANLAISLASSLQLDHFILEDDSQVVLLALQNPYVTQDWRISSLIMRTLESVLASSSKNAHKILRSANFCTHHVAHWAVTRFFSGSILTILLSSNCKW